MHFSSFKVVGHGQCQPKMSPGHLADDESHRTCDCEKAAAYVATITYHNITYHKLTRGARRQHKTVVRFFSYGRDISLLEKVYFSMEFKWSWIKQTLKLPSTTAAKQNHGTIRPNFLKRGSAALSAALNVSLCGCFSLHNGSRTALKRSQHLREVHTCTSENALTNRRWASVPVNSQVLQGKRWLFKQPRQTLCRSIQEGQWESVTAPPVWWLQNWRENYPSSNTCCLWCQETSRLHRGKTCNPAGSRVKRNHLSNLFSSAKNPWC